MSGTTTVIGSPGQTIDAQAFSSLQSAFRGDLLVPGNAEYDAARSVWNAMVDKRPALIARCRAASDVIAVVNFARERGLLVSDARRRAQRCRSGTL